MNKEQEYMTKEIEKIIGEQLMAIANMRVQIRLLMEELEELKKSKES